MVNRAIRFQYPSVIERLFSAMKLAGLEFEEKTPSNGLQNINFDDITNVCGFPALASNEFCQLFYFQSANHRTDRPNVFRPNTPTSLLKSIVFPSCRHSILTTYAPILSDCLSQRRNWIPL